MIKICSGNLTHPKTIRRILLCPLILFSLGMISDSSFSEFTLTILHTNDTYGRLTPFEKDDATVGGVLRRAYLIRQIRAAAKENLLLLDSGDAIGPYPLAAFDSGETVIQLMNEMGYTAMTLGNHEFNYGVEVLKERIEQAQFAVLSANTLLKDTGRLLAQGYLIKTVSGVKVGIIGLTTPTTRYRASPQLREEIKFGNPIAMGKDAVKKLKAEGCDFIIALSHLGYQGDMELIAQVRDINLLVGSEVELPVEKTIAVMTPIDAALGSTLVYCPWFGGYLGRVDVQLEEKTEGGYMVRNIRTHEYRLDEATYPNEVIMPALPALSAKLQRLVADYQQAYHGVLGRLAENEDINTLELIPLILRWETKAEIVLLNRGSLQAEIFSGEIVRMQVAESIRYSNHLVLLELTGTQLKAALAHSDKQESESRKLILLGLDAKGVAVNGCPIDENEYYTVATNDFLASGGDGYEMLASGRKKKDTGRMIRQVIIDYIQDTHAQGNPISLAPLKASLQSQAFVVKSKVGLDLTLKGLTVSKSAVNYPKISSLQSQNVGHFAHWSIQTDLSTILSFRGNSALAAKTNLVAPPRYSLELGLMSKYGRIQHPQVPSVELDDNTKASGVFRFLPAKRKFHPISRLEIENIEFTPSEENRIVAQLSAGIEQKLFSRVGIASGILLRRHQGKEESQNQVNFDFRANYPTTVRSVQIQSELKFFPIVFDTKTTGRAFKDYIASLFCSAKLPLNKYLSLSSSAILYRETQIGRWACNAQIAIQLHRTWGKKP